MKIYTSKKVIRPRTVLTQFELKVKTEQDTLQKKFE